ncbi:MAG: hypothetical protein ACHQ7M_07100 [Chloroflexota bacterium]
MLLAFSGLAAVVLLLLALRLTQRLTLRFNLLAGVSVSRQPQKSCPHLGASADPFTHEHQPSEDHRCYLWMQRDRIDLVHQKSFCLTTAHHKCPWLMVRHPNSPPPLRKRLPRIILGLPRTAWGGLRLAPGLVLAAVATLRMAFKRASVPRPPQREGASVPRPPQRESASVPLPPRWERLGEGTSPAAASESPGERARTFPERVFAACGLAPSPSLSPREGRGTGRKLAAVLASVAAAVRAGAPRLATIAARVGAGLLVATIWTGHMLLRLCLLLAQGLRWLAPRVARAIAWSVRKLAQAVASRREKLMERQVPSPQPSPVATAEGVVEPAPQPSLAKVEELLAEGLATLDRGQESLAYHIFAKATEQRAPRGAGETYADAMKRAWFWRAKTAETIEEVVLSLEKALQYEPGNLQMQAHLAWARQRLERERKLMPIAQAPPAPAPEPRPVSHRWSSLGVGVRMIGGLMALALAALWMTTAVMPALGRFLTQLPAGDELLLRRLILTLNAAALPGQGHLPLPVLNYDLGLSLPFVMAFSFIFTARGLMDGDSWARTTGLFFAGVGGWLCAAAVSNPDAGRLGLGLCVGIIVAAVAGRFDAPKRMPRELVGY